ncbi:hypothetical protein [Hymenobacter coccineus]|uniref:Uncharacterized protein n=1 Tax=Hymenobacter coccineus TaxID=1908235 RepID=A0A1G1SW88_9BACT|nr:hypothetical protein [Hymenobacter coccineus]OGX82898.1 hypothetical protein BEN49_13165 [Hymenobacter coccineus]
MPAPLFFQAADLLLFQHRSRTNPYYNKKSLADQNYAAQIKELIFEKTVCWGELVEQQLPRKRYGYIKHRVWTQGTHLRRYSWGHFFLSDLRDKAFYFTLGVDSGETEDAKAWAADGVAPTPALILKIDGHFAKGGTLTLEQHMNQLQTVLDAARWHRIGYDELSAYTWPRLVAETTAFMERYEGDLRRIMIAVT